MYNYTYSQAVLHLLLPLLVLGQTLAVAPGDESSVCGEPDYPANIRVLMDSWRYQTLLPGDDTDTEAVWRTLSTGDKDKDKDNIVG